jgi:hypothetical protein
LSLKMSLRRRSPWVSLFSKGAVVVRQAHHERLDYPNLLSNQVLSSAFSQTPATKNQGDDQTYCHYDTADRYTYKPPVDFKTYGYAFIAVHNDEYWIVRTRELFSPAIKGVPERRDCFKGNDSPLAVTFCIWKRPGFGKIDLHCTTAGADIHGQAKRVPRSGCFCRFRGSHCSSH